MDRSEEVEKPHTSLGDIAVDGIITGLEAGLLMVAFLMVAAALQGASPGTVLAAFTVRGAPSLGKGLLTHLTVSSVYGILFNLGYSYLIRLGFGAKNPLIGPLLGFTYGMLLFLAAEYILFDYVATALRDAPMILLLGAHLVYGFTLGLLVARRSKKMNK